jgi:hypothetical protein
MSDATETTAPAASQESTADGSTDLDQMLDNVASPDPEPKPYLLSPELFARQAEELGSLRARNKEMESRLTSAAPAPTAAAPEDFDWSNPTASLNRVLETERKRIRDEIMGEVQPQIAPARDAMMVQQLAANSPLAASLLGNADVVNHLKQIASNPDLMRGYEDIASVRLRAALFDAASNRAVLRSKALAAVKGNRPENAGAQSPAVAATAAAPAQRAETPKGMDEAWKAFGAGVAALPGSRSL